MAFVLLGLTNFTSYYFSISICKVHISLQLSNIQLYLCTVFLIHSFVDLIHSFMLISLILILSRLFVNVTFESLVSSFVQVSDGPSIFFLHKYFHVAVRVELIEATNVI